MEKMPTLFVRSGDPFLATEEITVGCEWVINGEGIATEKIDGTCCMIRDGKLFCRRAVKPGKIEPRDFEFVAFHPTSGFKLGWIPFNPENPDHKWHVDAFNNLDSPEDGTYELIGAMIQGNPYGLDDGDTSLIKHGAWKLNQNPRTYNDIKTYLGHHRKEGIVWHHPSGKMCKIKRRDFGIVWP